MAKLTRQLLKLAKGGNEEWWRLVFDTEAQRLYIEHEWSHTDAWLSLLFKERDCGIPYQWSPGRG